jgi:hypothetical protein
MELFSWVCQKQHMVTSDTTIKPNRCVVAILPKWVWQVQHHARLSLSRPPKPFTAFSASPKPDLSWATKGWRNQCLSHAADLVPAAVPPTTHESKRQQGTASASAAEWEKDWSFGRRNGGAPGQEKIGTAQHKSFVGLGERTRAISQSWQLFHFSLYSSRNALLASLIPQPPSCPLHNEQAACCYQTPILQMAWLPHCGCKVLWWSLECHVFLQDWLVTHFGHVTRKQAKPDRSTNNNSFLHHHWSQHHL